MKDGYYLLSYKVNGIKNLDKDVKLEFYKKTIDKDFDPREYNVKAIYGENGTGKSAIVTSVYILKELMLNNSYLSQRDNIDFLNKYINYKTKKLSLEIEFIYCGQPKVKIYKYVIEISNNNDYKQYKICREIVYQKSINSNSWSIVYGVENNELIKSSTNSIFKDYIIDNGKNVFSDKSVVSNYLLYKTLNITKTEIKPTPALEFNLITSLINCVNFAKSIFVYLEDSDFHQNITKYDEFLFEFSNGESEIKRIPIVDNVRFSRFGEIDYEFSINKNNYKECLNTIDKACEFIKVFKPQLKKINVDPKENIDKYECKLVFDYGDYGIDAEYESNGIKKLLRVFKVLDEVDKGNIAFIDEFDSNIHDVYLCRLIEYIEEHAKGQLCFTTQSITVMDVLENRKKSLDFLSRDHEITSWFKNSHYSASRKYKEGYIDKSPFNIESFDFLKAFGAAVDEK